MQNLISYLVFLIVALLFCSCDSNEQLKIKGVVDQYEDDVQVVLANANSSKPLDSAILKEGKFEFKTEPLDTVLYAIRIKNEAFEISGYEQLVFFVEDQDISINGAKGELKYSKVTGGDIQNQYQAIMALTEPLSRKFDRVNKALSDAYQKGNKKELDSITELHTELINKRLEIGLDYALKNPNHYMSLLRIEAAMPLFPIEEIAEVFNLLDDKLKNHRVGLRIQQVIKQKEIKVGSAAPDFTLMDQKGDSIRLSQYKGKYVLLVFWASWCGSCRIENKKLAEIHPDLSAKGLEIISINGDTDQKKWLKAAQEDGISWHNLIDTDSSDAFLSYRVLLIPSNFLIDPTGKVIKKGIEINQLEAELTAYFD